MVQQTIDSKFSEYGLASSETGFPKHDKQQPVALAAKKTALRDLQNDNRNMVPKSGASSVYLKESGPAIEMLKVSGTKRTQSECLVRSPRHQSSTSNVNGHLVYVRRKTEAESGKSSTIDNTSNRVDSTQSRQRDVQDERIQQQSHTTDSRTCTPEPLPVPRALSESLSSTKPSVSLALGKSNSSSPPAEPNVHVASAISSLDYSKRSRVQHWEERYGRLQNLLRILNLSNQEDYLQMLRSLSSVDLSRLAVELEKRSIQLSLEEAKEVKRVRVLDVLGKYPRNSGAPPLTQHEQSEK